MLTLLILVWLFSTVPAISLSARARDGNGFGYFLILYAVGWLVFFGLTTDLHVADSRRYDDDFLVLWGTVNLGVNSIVYLLFRGAKKITDNDAPSTAGSFAVFVSLIGFVSSFLGIVSFFWDHLFKK